MNLIGMFWQINSNCCQHSIIGRALRVEERLPAKKQKHHWWVLARFDCGDAPCKSKELGSCMKLQRNSLKIHVKLPFIINLKNKWSIGNWSSKNVSKHENSDNLCSKFSKIRNFNFEFWRFWTACSWVRLFGVKKEVRTQKGGADPWRAYFLPLISFFKEFSLDRTGHP